LEKVSAFTVLVIVILLALALVAVMLWVIEE